MSWAPNDLLTDADLLAYERDILTRFNVADWRDRRTKTLEDWLWPQLRTNGFAPERFRTRFTPHVAFGFTSSVYTDVTAAVTNTTADDLNLATTLAASSDALVIGSDRQFRGVSVRMLDAVSAVENALTVEFWMDGWRTLPALDTTAVGGASFARGGSITWRVPDEWVLRTLGANTTPYYYARLRLSAAPTSAKAGQISVIRRSVLCGPVAYRTLAMIFREAPMAQDGPWADKATFYETEAALALQRAYALVGGEFDADTPSDDVLDRDDEAQTRDTAGSPMRWERA
jgi:hypothetical protein